MIATLPKRALGDARLSITELGFGGAGIGNLYREVADRTADNALDAAWREGLRYFDTAPYYGFGLSETRLGDHLRTLKRGSFVLSSKVGRLLAPTEGMDAASSRHGFVSSMPFEPIYDYTYDGVMLSFESSLRRLGLERIDVLFLHDLGAQTHGDDHPQVFRTAMDHGYPALRKLRDEGRIQAIGIGANEWEVCDQAMDHGDFDCFLLAGRYTLLEQSALDRFLPRCQAQGVSVVVGGPFNSGILATGTALGQTMYYNYKPAPAGIIARVERIEAQCRRFGVPLAAAALQFPLAHPAVASVIPGLASVRDVEQALAHYRHPIPEAFWRALMQGGLIHSQAPTPNCAVGVA